MRQVIIVSLNNRAYHMDEDAYAAVRRYLDSARTGLRDNPDMDEILGDVERAISEKCAAVLGPGKDVVSSEEMAAILQEVGPVDGDPIGASDSYGESEPNESDGPKRLYRQPKGAMVEGVCMGLSEYFNVDVVIFRLLFAILTLASGGIGGGLYLLMIMIVPSREPERPKARTPWRRPRPSVLIIGGVLLIFLVLLLLPWLDQGVSRDVAGEADVYRLGLVSALPMIVLAALFFIAALVWFVIAKYIGSRTKAKD